MKNTKFKVFIALMMVLTLLSTLMLIPSFADETSNASAAVSDDSQANAQDTSESAVSGDTSADAVSAADGSQELSATTTKAADDGWVTLSVSDYIAIAVAAVVAVAFVVVIVLFVPKKTKQK